MSMSLRGTPRLARSDEAISRLLLTVSYLGNRRLLRPCGARNDINVSNYAIFTIFQKSVKPIGFHSKPDMVLRTPNSAAGWYKTA